MRLAQLLRLWRRQNRLTLRIAAGKIGLHPSTLARLERGEQMHGATLATLLVWLMGREEPSANEAFTFTAPDATAGEEAATISTGHTNAVGDREADGEKEAGQVYREAFGKIAAALAEEPETPAEPALHALDQDTALCGLRPNGLGGGTHGAERTGDEVTG